MSNRLIWAAVDLNVRLFNWDRALGIAEQSDDPMHVQGVLWLRCANECCQERWRSGNTCSICCIRSLEYLLEPQAGKPARNML